MIYKQYTIELFKKYSSFFAESHDHYIIRCPYCGDSRKRKNYGHLYISKNQPVFRCNRCGFGSSVKKLLNDLCYQDIDIKDIVNDDYDIFENYYSISRQKYLVQPDKVLEYENILESLEKNINLHKLNYLEERLKNHYLYDIKLNKNIIINVLDLFKRNYLLQKNLVQKYGEQKTNNLINFLDKNFIGFVCYKKNSIIFRNTDKNSNFRYFKIKLFNEIEDFFVIDDMLHSYKEIPKVIMGEGVFDVILPYLQKNNSGTNEYFNGDIYIASGKSYTEGLKFLATQKCIAQFDIYILSDSDVDMYHYDSIFKRIKKLVNKMKIVLNLNNKDFGVFDTQPTVSKIY